jgi:hypothetical protein
MARTLPGVALMTRANPTSKRIGQLIRMLSSDQPGEAGAAVQALNRTLASAGTDIHQLAEIVERGLQLPLPMEQPARRPRPPTRTTKARRPNGRPLQMDEKLVCDQPGGVFRACACGGFLFTVMPGVGPHVAQLVCDDCKRGGRWLSRYHFGAAP